MVTDTRSKGFDADTRGRKVVFVANCVPNRSVSNRTATTVASQPPAIRAVIRLALDHDVEVVPMPCPERSCFFAQRWGGVRADFDNPAFRRRCQLFAEQVLDQVMAYQATGREIVGIVMRDGSPTCGVKRACVAVDAKPPWSGMIWQVPQQRFADTEGVFSEILQTEAKRRGLDDLHLLAVPEVPPPDSSESLVQIRRAMSSTSLHMERSVEARPLEELRAEG
jgi:predicted secreted protein